MNLSILNALNVPIDVWDQIALSTRQNSTQSVGNMPPLPLRHLLPHVLQIMPRKPKHDQFQSKGHHNEENPPSTTKMPGNPNLTHFTQSIKIRKINQLWSLSNQFWRWSGYISMQNVRPFPQWVLQEMIIKPQIWHISLCQNSAKIRKINRPWP